MDEKQAHRFAEHYLSAGRPQTVAAIQAVFRKIEPPGNWQAAADVDESSVNLTFSDGSYATIERTNGEIKCGDHI